MLIKYKTERKTGLSFPGFEKVVEDKSFKLNVEQLTFRKICFGLFCIAIYLFIGSFSDFISTNGTVENRSYVNNGVVVDDYGQVEFMSHFADYRGLEGFDYTLTTTVRKISDFITGYDINGAGKLNFKDWMRERFPEFTLWEEGSFDDDSWWGFGLNRLQRLVYGIVEFVGRFFYTLFYRLSWILDMLFKLLE